MERIKGCQKHTLAKQGCQICNGKIGTYHGRAKQIEKLQGMVRAYRACGAGATSQLSAELKKLQAQQNEDTV